MRLLPTFSALVVVLALAFAPGAGAHKPIGATFARSLAAHGLIDEYRINVQPVVLGDGLPLLHGLDEPLRLELVSSTAWSDGPITQTYIPR